jgi:GNAT superfamily N-acetyltransferase
MTSKTTPKFTAKTTPKITPKISLTDTPDDGMLNALGKQLMDFNEVRSGRPLDYRSLTIFVTHPDSGELLGGLWGGTSYSHLHIELVYLPEDLRGADLGSQLMAQAEQEAIQRGCLGFWLDTFSFQARGFYERLGYTVFGTFEDCPPGHSRFFLRKALKRTLAGTYVAVEPFHMDAYVDEQIRN